MRVLITGGSGFIGTALTRRLLKEGCQVRIFDLRPPDEDGLTVGREVVLGDVRDPRAVQQAIIGCQAVVHVAARVPLSRSGKAFREVNVTGTRVVLEASLQAGFGQVLHVSSSAVYGIPATLPVDESAPLTPFEAYGVSKQEAEQVCQEFRRRGLDVRILRPRTVLGPGRLGILSVLFDWIRTGRRVYILGSGENRYQFVDVEDFAEACALALASPRGRNQDFNVGAREFGTLREDLTALIRYAGSHSPIVSIPSVPGRAILAILGWLRLSPLVPYQFRMISQDMWFDTERAERLLGWRPQYSNVAALTRAYDWYIARAVREASSWTSPHQEPVQEGILRLLRLFK